MNNNSKNRKLNAGTEHKIVADRIRDYIINNELTQKEFAESVGVSSCTVNRWLNGKTNLPPVYRLKDVADAMNITVDNLVTGEESRTDHPVCSTYSNAFLSIAELSETGIIHFETRDPFLKWLLDKKMQIDHMPSIDEKKKDAWMKKVLQDYNRPLLPIYLTQYLDLFRYKYMEIEEYDTFMTVFRLFQGYEDGDTKEEVDQLIESWKNSVTRGTGEFAFINVPWFGGDKLYEIDENGNIYMTNKPANIQNNGVDPSRK